MKYIICAVVSFCFFIAQAYAQTLNLPADLKDDIVILKTQNYDVAVTINRQTEKMEAIQLMRNLSMIKNIAKLDISKSKFAQTVNGDFKLSKWEMRSGDIKSIYQLEMNTAVDTIVDEIDLSTKKVVARTPVKSNFQYTYYLVKLADKGALLSYVTEKGVGLLRYQIDNKMMSVAYETNFIEPHSPYQKLMAAIKTMIN